MASKTILTSLLTAACLLVVEAPINAAAALPITGVPVPELSAFDVAVTNFMRANAIKGGALAVMKDGRLVFHHGYGFRDQAQTVPFDPDTRVRIASNSKTFTAAAIKVLMERGLIASNTLAVPFVGIRPFTGVFGDARYGQIEVQHLVAHRSGFEPNDSWFDSATAMGLDRIQTAAEEISWRFTLPLEFTPGSGSAYSGQGYSVLGRVIEKASGLDFVTFVQRHVARTWGVPGVQLERTEPKLRALDESWYDGALSPSGINLVNFPSAEIVPGPDGGAFVLESGDAPGGLITSVRGLVTLAQAALVSHGTFFAPQATIPTVLHGDRRRFRHLPGVGAQSGWEPGARSFNLQNTNGVDLAVFFNLEIQEPTFGDFVAQLKRLTETTAVWPGDNSTRIDLAADSFSVVENEGFLVIGVRRTGDSAGVVAANYTTMPGTALSGTEFTAVSGTVTFTNDEITRIITIPILDNATAGPAKSFRVVLSDPTGGAALGVATATVTIEDDDNRRPPSVVISSPASGTNFTQGADVAITATPADVDGTIYTVKFFAGPTLIGEENKPPYTFRWRSPGAGTYSLTARAIDNDGLMATSAPVVVTVGAGLVSSSPGTIRSEFWHRRPANTMVLLTNYSFYPDTPTGFEYLDRFEISTNRGDYYGSRVLGYVLPPSSGAYTFWIAADDVAELWLSTNEHPGNKQRIASVSSPVAPHNWIAQASQRSAAIPMVAGQRYYIEALHRESTGSDHLAVGWQLPDGTLERPISGSRLALFQPAARLYAEETLSVNEGNGGVTDVALQLRLVTTTGGTFTVAFATSNGTASAGSDYLATNGTIPFGPGQTHQTLHLGILSDLMDESNETFTVNLTTTDDLALMSTRSRVTIIDDDEPPALSIEDVALKEGDTGLAEADFTVRLPAPSAFLVRARYATANGTALSGADYVATNGILSFPPGTTNQLIVVQIVGDTLIESNETFLVSLSSPSNATIDRGQGVGTILDDDFKITAIQHNASGVSIRFTTAAGISYRVEWTDSLATPINWSAVTGAEHLSGTGANVEVIDSGGALSSQRFYRIRVN